MNPFSKIRSIIIVILGGKEAKPRFDFRISQPKPKSKKGQMVTVKITNEQKIKVTLAPVTATGKPAPLDGKPVWNVASGKAQTDISEDGLSCTIISPDEPGETLIEVSADADLGEGVETIADAIKVVVEGAKATSLGLTVGDPEPK